MTEKKDALATTSDVTLAVMDPEQRIDLSLLTEELGEDASIGLSIFTRVKIPSGGSVQWEIANDDDPNDPEYAKSIEGVIVANHKVNAYWSKSMEDGGDAAPDCSSRDGITGYGVRMASDAEGSAHACAECPLNEFGSDADGGKACKNQRHLYILRPDEVLPLCVVLSPASLKGFETYTAKSIILKRRRLHGVITRIGLEKAKSGGGIEYSRATFTFGGELAPEAAEYCAKMGEELKALVTEHTAPIISEPTPQGDDLPF